MNTLIIDDDIFVQKALELYLRELGHQVTLAGNGQEAIELIAKNHDVDLIFCDVMMPSLTGPSFLILLKKHFPKEAPAIVIISGLRDGEEFLKKLDTRYDYFLKKPVDREELRELTDKIAVLKTK